MCSNVQASNSSQEAIEKLIKDGMQCPSKTKPIKYNVAKNEVSPPVCCRTLYFLAIDNERRTPVQPTVRRRISRSCRSVEDSFCDTARKLEKTPYAHCENNAMHVSKTTIVHCLAPQKNRARNLCRSQASKTENSEVAQIAYEVAEQFPQLHTGERMEEYNDTRRWRCYEAALLMKKNEIRTDEEAPLTTPVDASVLEYYRASPRGSLQNCVLRSDRNSF
jgi:hypothetical protein